MASKVFKRFHRALIHGVRRMQPHTSGMGRREVGLLRFALLEWLEDEFLANGEVSASAVDDFVDILTGVYEELKKTRKKRRR